MIRSALATINLNALRHNFLRVQAYAKNANIIAIIKANAYGHGIDNAVAAIDDITNAYGVSCVPEGLELRQLTSRPILVLQGFQTLIDIDQAKNNQLRLMIHDQEQINLLQQYAHLPANQYLVKNLYISIKIDTGMHRLGLPPKHIHKTIKQLKTLSIIHDDIWLCSHFSSADDENNYTTHQQLAVFDQISQPYPYQQCLANSAGIIAWPNSHRQWVRPGIMLYGANPLLSHDAHYHQLQAVMTLSAPIISIHQLKKGDAIGYGRTWVCQKDQWIAIIACGYADGYPRHAPSGTKVWINQQFTQLLGRVSMDTIVISLHNINAKIGDFVELWGQHISVDSVALAAETISYEILCHAGNNSIKKVIELKQ